MSSNPDTIARLLNQAGEHIKSAICAPPADPKGAAPHIDAAMHCIHQAFQEAIGGAAYAHPQPEGPWVVRATYVCVDGKDGIAVYASDTDTTHTSSLSRAHLFPSRDGLLEQERSKWGSAWRIEVLTLAEAQRMEAEAEIAALRAAAGEPMAWAVLPGPGDAAIRGTTPWVYSAESSAKTVASDAQGRRVVPLWAVRAIPRDAVQPPAKQWLADLGGDPDGYALVATTEHIGCRFSERAQADEHAAAFERLHPDHVAAPLPLAEALRIDAAEHAKEQPAPAPREPDGWVVVNDTGAGPRADYAWLRTEYAAEQRAKDAAETIHGTARPFWLDPPPLSGVAWEAARAGEEAATLRAEVERLTRERDELAKALQRTGIDAADDAHTDADVAMAREDLRENGYNLPALAECVGRLIDDRNAALSLARRCREVALGERERIAGRFDGDGTTAALSIRTLPAPTLPEVP